MTKIIFIHLLKSNTVSSIACLLYLPPMKKLITFICFLLFLINHSQENEINYVVDFITTQQGLSHNYTTSILSDDLNVKWIGTENGITKYNGYDFEYIKPEKKYSHLINSHISFLV